MYWGAVFGSKFLTFSQSPTNFLIACFIAKIFKNVITKISNLILTNFVRFDNFFFSQFSHSILLQKYVTLGNDEESYAFDGSRKVRCHNEKDGKSDSYGVYWAVGDVIGCLLDADAKKISFYRNGKDL